MKTNVKFLMIAVVMLSFSCGQKGGDDLETKKKTLAAYMREANELNTKITALENEISAQDPGFNNGNEKTVLVTTADATIGEFAHYIEITGSILSKKNVNISAEVSGRIQELRAVEGQRIQKGEVLALVDAESVDRNIEEVEKQLELATILFDKQKRLWDQKIGTEIQFLEAKNRKEILEKNLASILTQKDKTTIRAPFNGTVEEVTIRLGELVQPGSPIMNFIGDSDLYIEGDLSERYVGVLNRGDSVELGFPSLGKRLMSRITSVGGVIDPNNRTFKVEAYLPRGENYKPNMISVIKIKDYENKDAVVVPAHLVLEDKEGDYVFVVEGETAQKTYIRRGVTYQGKVEVLEGLQGGEVLVDKGFRDIGDNFKVSIAQN